MLRASHLLPGSRTLADGQRSGLGRPRASVWLAVAAVGLLGFASGARAEADASTSELGALVQLLGQIDDAAVQLDVLRGMHQALNGRRQAGMPEGWASTYPVLARSPNAEVREISLTLAVIFGDPQALAELHRTVRDPQASPAARQNALQALIQKREPELVSLLQTALAEPALRGTAVRGLAAYSHADTPALILRRYAEFSEAEQRDAIGTLSSRPAYALALLAAVERGQVPRRDLTAFTVRQLGGLHDRAVDEKVKQVWGEIRAPSSDKAEFIARYKKLLTPEALKNADRAHGRAVFVKTCAACHRLFDDGGKIGPELTGAQRGNLDYLLENLLDPSAVVPRDYQMTLIQTTEGRVITGIVKQENEATVTLQLPNESLILPKEEIEERQRSPLSMMPEGLLNDLPQQDVRDLVAYLASPEQVPLPASSAPPTPGAR